MINFTKVIRSLESEVQRSKTGKNRFNIIERPQIINLVKLRSQSYKKSLFKYNKVFCTNRATTFMVSPMGNDPNVGIQKFTEVTITKRNYIKLNCEINRVRAYIHRKKKGREIWQVGRHGKSIYIYNGENSLPYSKNKKVNMHGTPTKKISENRNCSKHWRTKSQ